MNSKKIYALVLSLAVLVVAVGCTTDGDTGLNNQDRLSTQTRINRDWNRDDNVNKDDNLLDNDLGLNDRTNNNGLNDNLNDGMVRNRENDGNINNDSNRKANDIAEQIVDEIPEVEDANVVLNDNTCLVGVELDNNVGNTNRNNTINDSLRDKIRNIVEEHTDNIDVENISISADPEITGRIADLSKNMADTVGNDFNKFTNDIEKIVNDIVR